MVVVEVHILFCACINADIVPRGVREAVLAGIRAAAADVSVVSDLCGAAVEKPSCLRDLAAMSGLRVLACHPRAVRGLFRAAGAPLRDDAAVLDLRRLAPREVFVRLGCAPPGPAVAVSLPAADPGAWMPWFPVIDHDRCCNCKQCLSFCLFGVYAAPDNGRVEVRKPRNCKTHCPACARVCPRAAIVFPKCPEPMISGDVPADDGAATGTNVKVDLDRLMGDDALAALAARRRGRGKRLRRDATDAP
jgi:Pyruvate/2-oxoacid:ferredoxin oxidoreductase delta subunit